MEFENVLPSEIEKRSFEIIESELPYDIEKTIKPIVKRVIHTTILIILTICVFRKTWLRL